MPKKETYPGFYEPAGIKPLSGEDTIKYVQNELGQTKVLLSFSCGKDSVALWLALRDRFEIVPFYLYRIPGISFVEDSLNYYEDYFGQEIVRLPHPTFYRMLANLVWQPPERVGVLLAMNLFEFSYDDLNDLLSEHYDIPEPMCATGIRAVDNIWRRTAMIQRGPINMKRRYFYPIWDMNIAQVQQELVNAKVKLGVDYRLFGRSFDGMDYRFMKPVKDNYPQDWELIKEWFPFVEMEILRYSAHDYKKA